MLRQTLALWGPGEGTPTPPPTTDAAPTPTPTPSAAASSSLTMEHSVAEGREAFFPSEAGAQLAANGKLNPPKPHPRVKAAGIGADPPIPAAVTEHPADAWQPPRLRTITPLSSYKYQYRGGWKLFFDSARVPLGLSVGFIFLYHTRNYALNAYWGETDPDALELYHDFDDKRPIAFPPRMKRADGQEQVFGVHHEVTR